MKISFINDTFQTPKSQPTTNAVADPVVPVTTADKIAFPSSDAIPLVAATDDLPVPHSDAIPLVADTNPAPGSDAKSLVADADTNAIPDSPSDDASALSEKYYIYYY